jgi:hypothetical protein
VPRRLLAAAKAKPFAANTAAMALAALVVGVAVQLWVVVVLAVFALAVTSVPLAREYGR